MNDVRQGRDPRIRKKAEDDLQPDRDGPEEGIYVLCSGAFIEVLRAIVPTFEQATGISVELSVGSSFGATGRSIPWRLESGERADLVILFDDAIDRLACKGFIIENTKFEIAKSHIGLAVRTGAELPDISSAKALRSALLEATSIAYSASSSGIFVSQTLFQRLGIADAVGPKARRIENERVGNVVARGEAEIGFQQISELLPIEGISVVGALPEDLQQTLAISGGIPVTVADVKAVQLLRSYLATPVSRNFIRQGGLDPS